MNWEDIRELGSFTVLLGAFIYMGKFLMNGFSKKLDIIIDKLDQLITLQRGE